MGFDAEMKCALCEEIIKVARALSFLFRFLAEVIRAGVSDAD